MLGALLPVVGPGSTAAQIGWFVFLIPIILAAIAAIIDVVQQLVCTGRVNFGHVLLMFVLAFAIAHYFGIWGVAAGALKGFASLSATAARRGVGNLSRVS